MNTRTILKLSVITAIMAAMAGCKGNKAVIDPTVRLAYEKEPTAENMENLSKAYAGFINKNRKTGKKEPGVYSDYAVTLVKLGRRAEANSWFNKEMEAYPSSRQYVMQLKRMLIPEYQDNNSITTDSASMDEAEGLSEKTRKEAEDRAAKVMEESNKEIENAVPEAAEDNQGEEEEEAAVEEVIEEKEAEE